MSVDHWRFFRISFSVLCFLFLPQQLESLSFFRDGSEFISAHADGSYIIWATTEPNRQRDLASTPYGQSMLPISSGFE